MSNRRWMRPWLGALAGLIVSAATLAAQTGTIAGTVRSADTGEPLVGAQITVEGTSVGALSNADGRFLVQGVPVGARTVRAVLIGFANATATVDVMGGGTATVELRMSPEAISLSEIVVTGVAGATQRTKLPFDVAQVRTADLPVPTVNAAQAIQGKVAGATVVMGSGRPGAAPSILLRGAKSLDASGRDQEPLYIVDGVILGSSLVDLDALDIQSVEVVKGAAAASLYGSRAAAGVIQIRTKRGAELADDEVHYTLRTEYGASEMANYPDDLLAERHPFVVENGMFVDSDGTPCEYLECTNPQITGTNAWDSFVDQEWPGTTYNQVERFFTGSNFFQSHITAEGRSGKTNFHVSGSYLNQEGVLRFMPGFERTNFRVNVDQSVTDGLTLQTSVFYSKSDQGRPTESSGNVLFDLTRAPAGVDLLSTDANGDIIRVINPTELESTNPIYTLKNYKQEEYRSRFLGSGNLRWAATDWLKFDANLSYDRLDLDREYFREKGFLCADPADCITLGEGTLYKFRAQDDAMNASVTASAVNDFGENIRNTTQLRYLYEEDDYEWFDTYGWGYAVAGVPTFDNINQNNVSSDSYLRTIRADGYFAITNFDLYDKYVIDALIRNDGSSLFGEDQRRQWYYRVGGAWRLGEEDFFTVPGVDELKLRYSVGTAGGRPAFEAQYETYNVAGGFISPVSLGNQDLRPEHTTEHEAGLDMGLFNYRALLTLTYAQATTKDQILPVPQPAYSGFQTQWQNAGTVQSKTWEAALDLRLIQGQDLNWSTKILFDRTRSTITELDVPAFTYGVPGQNLGEVFFAREGEEVGTFYGAVFARSCADLPSSVSCDGFQVNDDGFLVWTGPGGFNDLQWGAQGPAVLGTPVSWGTPFQGICLDADGEETVSCPVGNTIPDYNVNLSTSLNWKNLTAYALFTRSAGFDIFNQTLEWAHFRELTGVFEVQEGATGYDKKPRGYYNAWYGQPGLGPDNIFVEDGSFTKLREVSLGYRLGQNLLGKIPALNRFSGVGITLTGRNLFTWTDYRGYDPEVGKTGGDVGSAAIARVDGYTYPNFRTYTAALELTF